jgi:UDP-glucose 4-epimerase
MILNNARRVLIIGGAGFIGIHTAKLLEKKGYQIALVDNFSASTHDLVVDEFNLYELDASVYAELARVYDDFNPNYVIILSSIVDVPETIRNPLIVQSGIVSLMNACELSSKHNILHNIYASSGYVYGNCNQIPYSESNTVDPVNPYNISKIFCENLINFYGNKYGLSTVIMRYAPTYGPRRRIGPIIDFIDKAIKQQQITLYGEVTRDYIYVEDVALANLRAIETNTNGVQIFNIGTGIEVTLEETYLLICKILNTPPRNIIKNEPKDREINRFCLDITKAKFELGFSNSHTFDEGLIKTIRWYEDIYA